MSSIKKILLIGSFIVSCSLNAAQAAFPMHTREVRRAEQMQRRIEKAEIILNHSAEQQERLSATERAYTAAVIEDDEGIYGILSFVTAILGIFPAAIVLGIIGLQPNRRFQGLAAAGLILGLFEAFIFLLFVVLLLWVLSI